MNANDSMEMIDAYEMVDDPDDCEIVVIEASAATEGLGDGAGLEGATAAVFLQMETRSVSSSVLLPAGLNHSMPELVFR